MIEIERHIEILLLSNDCVIVPNLGGFVAHHVDARFDEEDSTFLPPLRTLGFNPQLKMNDSLLVQSYIEAYDISYPEALRRIESEVEELRQYLETDGQVELNDLGLLRLNDEGNIEFEPCESGILTPTLYGLSSFEMQPLAVAQPEEIDESQQLMAEAEGDQREPAITIRMSWLRNAVAVAAAVVAFFMIGTPISNSNVQQSSFIHIGSGSSQASATTSDSTLSLQAAGTEANETVSADLHAKTPEETEATEMANPTPEKFFTLVLASQVSKRNATNFVQLLQEAGFPDASVMEGKMTRVVYGSFASEAEALDMLKSLRSQSRHFREAWVMKFEI